MSGPSSRDVPVSKPDPAFAVTMTVRNNVDSIERSVATILSQLGTDGELSIIDGGSTDGTVERLERIAAGRSGIHVASIESNRGRGRNLAVAAARAPVVLTHVDGDNLYADGVLRRVALALAARGDVDVLMAIGEGDRDPSVSRFYAWRRDAFLRIGGYVETQFMEDLGTLLKAFRAGLRVDRLRVPLVAEDLKPRRPREAPSVGPWQRSHHVYRAARKFRILGFRYGEYRRFLRLTGRTGPRLAAGLVIGSWAYLVGALTRDSLAFLTPEDADAAGVRAYRASRYPPAPPRT
jgi:glycosyltransferase involved in cell wall biosynthesis